MTEPNTYDVGIVGLDYVGLTLANRARRLRQSCDRCRKGEELVELTNNGVPHFTETGLQDALTRVTKSGKLFAAHEFDKTPAATPTSSQSERRCPRTAKYAWT
jgi:UDP-N-acetyl-D-mannosaminuronic acid dehydrogenase